MAMRFDQWAEQHYPESAGPAAARWWHDLGAMAHYAGEDSTHALSILMAWQLRYKIDASHMGALLGAVHIGYQRAADGEIKIPWPPPAVGAPQAVAVDWIDWPKSKVVKRKGQDDAVVPLKGWPENTAAMLDAYRATVRYNTMTHTVELRCKGVTPIAERVEGVMADWFATVATRHGLSVPDATAHLSLLADAYHPVLEWLDDVQHDGVSRIDDVLRTVSADDPLAAVLIRRWLLACVAALEVRDFRPPGVLVLQGPQGCGKTTWISELLPSDVRPGAMLLGAHLQPSDRDSVQQITSRWIVELGELDATMRKADVAAMKAFIDRPADTYRSAYARREETIPRRTMLAATVNPEAFLFDTTGNRRYWTVRVRSCDWQALAAIDRRQLWRELLEMVRREPQSYRLTRDEEAALARSNERHEVESAIAADIWQHWQPGPAGDGDNGWRTLTEIMREIPAFERAKISKYDRNEAAQALRDAGVAERPRSGSHPVRYAVRLRSDRPQSDRGYPARMG